MPNPEHQGADIRNRATASVKVMRSYDYCHFEVTLGSTEPLTVEDVDEFRKEAARLADHAVEQYKIAKANALRLERKEGELSYTRYRAEQIRQKPEGEWSPEEKAEVKAYDDAVHEFRAMRRYDYEDDWEDVDDQED